MLLSRNCFCLFLLLACWLVQVRLPMLPLVERITILNTRRDETGDCGGQQTSNLRRDDVRHCYNELKEEDCQLCLCNLLRQSHTPIIWKLYNECLMGGQLSNNGLSRIIQDGSVLTSLREKVTSILQSILLASMQYCLF